MAPLDNSALGVAAHSGTRKRERAPAAGSVAQSIVVILCPGGLEHGGGIGRQMKYFLAARGAADLPDYRVVDTRGPWFLREARGRFAASLGLFLRSAGSLIALRAGRRPSLVHVNITGRGSTVRKSLLCALARLLGLRYLMHVHEPDYLSGYLRLSRPVRRFVRTAFRDAVTVLVLGARDRERFIADLQLDGAHVQVLYNAVPDPRPLAPASRDLANPCRIVFLGHLSERKGVPELLRALASPALATVTWEATLAGGGAIDLYRSMAETLGIARRVSFPGWLGPAEVARLYAAADIAVLPSHGEGLAMSVLEAMSYGVPVITTQVGAHSEVIEPGVSGLFVGPGDVEGLASELARLINDPSERARLGVGGRRRYEERFEIGRYKQALTNIHLACLGTHAGRADKVHRPPAIDAA